MTSLFYIWISLGVLFILIEITTGTFYGLAVALGAFILGILSWVFGWSEFSVLQALLFAGLSALFSYYFPRIFRSKKPILSVGIDRYIGKTYTIARVGKDWKVKIEWVDYLVDARCITSSFQDGMYVCVEGHDSGVLNVSLVKM